MSTIERVARAIYEGRNGKGAVPWNRQPGAHKAPYLTDARAAIEAMREPTWQMEEAFNNASRYSLETTFETRWPAAIGAALAEGPEQP